MKENQKTDAGAATSPGPRIASALLALAAASVLAASVMCSYAIAHGASMHWRLAFRFLCHGIESRCLLAFGVPMPICARCAALYAGLIIGAAAVHALPSLREKSARLILAAALTPLAIDGFTQLVRLRESTNGLRVATGLSVGIALAMWCIASLRTVLTNP